MLAISAAVIAWGRKRPYLIVGWLWYLGTLVPVIGLVQVGTQARADRYTYLTQIGIYVLLAWGVADLTKTWRWRRCALCGGAAADDVGRPGVVRLAAGILLARRRDGLGPRGRMCSGQ